MQTHMLLLLENTSALTMQWRRFLLNSGGSTWRARSVSL